MGKKACRILVRRFFGGNVEFILSLPKESLVGFVLVGELSEFFNQWIGAFIFNH